MAKVLVADDDEAILRLCGRVLSTDGHDVVTVPDGDWALSALDNGDFDVMLTDVNMPAMGGVALLSAVRQRDLDLPVIFMTGDPDVDSAMAAVNYGALNYLIKPLDPNVVKREIHRAAALHDLARAKREAMPFLTQSIGLAGDRAGLETSFARAINSIWMAYQPIVDLKTRKIFGYEALARSTNRALPHVGALFDAAQRIGRLPELGRAIRSRIIDPEQLPEGTSLFVNLHASDLEDESLYRDDTPLAEMASKVVLEITERASLDNVSNVRQRIDRLRSFGYRIAVDDLGAGYAGLTSFAKLRPEIVKLDMSLIRDVHRDDVKRKLVESVTEICNDLGITVVAEGVETEDERDTVKDLGCDLFQGYLFARPDRPFPNVAW